MATTAKPREETLTARVQALVEEVLAATPHFVVEVAVRGTAGSRVVEVFLDSDAALGVDELARLSREVGFLLDTDEVVEGRYRLDVSSPGLDRPLKLPRQFKKNVGRTLRVHHRRDDADGYTETTGKLADADDEAIELAPAARERRRIRYGDILWAKVQLPW